MTETETGKAPLEIYNALLPFLGSHLQHREFQIGLKYPRTVTLVYLDGATEPSLIDEFTNRLESLNTGWIANTKHLTRLISDRSFWLFPEFQMTCRPDHLAMALSQGKALLMLNGETETVIAPTDFLSFFRKPGSKSGSWFSPGVMLRLIAFAAALFLPAFYIAMVSFQYYALPVQFFLMLAEFRAKTPLPPILEIILLEALIETIREGSRQLPGAPGKLTGALGGILVASGLAAGNFITPAAAVLCSAAFLASLAFPIDDLLYPTRIIVLVSIVMTALFGVLGMVITASLVVAYLLSLKSADGLYLPTLKGLKRL